MIESDFIGISMAPWTATFRLRARTGKLTISMYTRNQVPDLIQSYADFSMMWPPAGCAASLGC